MNSQIDTHLSGGNEWTTLVNALRGRSQIHPDKRLYTFVSDGDREDATLTYAELDLLARTIGATLQGKVGVGERALLLYPPGLEFIAAFFGCLYAGVVPVPAYPPDLARLGRTLPRLRAMVADAEAKVALTTSMILGITDSVFEAAPDLRALDWIATDALAHDASATWRAPAIDASTLAFLQYTSGSTSTPKGVMVSHGNICENERAIQEAFGHDVDTVIAGWLPVYHDMGLIGNVLQPLMIGASCYLMSPLEFLQRPLTWLKMVSRFRATTSGGPNFAYDLCARKIASEKVDLDLRSWKVAFNGAEPIRGETLARFAAAFEPYGFKKSAFYPCYGLAEGTLFVTGAERGHGATPRALDAQALDAGQGRDATDPERKSVTLISCGRTVRRDVCLIVDPQTRTRCAEGTVGEIWVSGTSVAQGYWRRADATEETFHATIAGGDATTFLRTGDLGFVRGPELFVTGRLKDLIILNGRNYYPQDIERTAESAAPGLRPGCNAAFSVEHEGRERVVLVQEVDRRFEGAPEDVIRAIRGAVSSMNELDLYGVVLIKPGSIFKTSSGKIQRRACRAAFLDGTLDAVESSVREVVDADAEPVALVDRRALVALAPGDRQAPVERHLFARVAQITGAPRSAIVRTASLGELGLDSLKAIEIKTAVEVDFGVSVPFERLFGGESIASLAEFVSVSLREVAAGDETQVTASGAPAVSIGQRALWFLQRLAPQSSAYNVVVSLRVTSPVDVAAFSRALDGLAQRHPALRTTYSSVAGEPRPIVAEVATPSFEEIDARAWSAHDLDARLADEACVPFDLERGPLLRARLYRRSESDSVLLLVVHHIAVDFWSLETMALELGALYDGARRASSSTLAPLTYGHGDFVRWQNALLAGDEGARQIDYWRNELAGVPAALDLPTDQPRGAAQTYGGASAPFVVPSDLVAPLEALAKRERVTMFTLLLAAFQMLLARMTGQEDIPVGTPVADRARAEFRDVVGYFVNPVVLRTRLEDDPPFDALLQRVKATIARALDHQDVPFPLLVEKLSPPRSSNRSPLFQTLFVLQKARAGSDARMGLLALGDSFGGLDLGGLRVEGFKVEQRIAQFDLALTMADAPGKLAGALQYNTDLFRDETAARINAHFVALLGSIARTPSARVRTLTADLDFPRAAAATDYWQRKLAREPAVPRFYRSAAMTSKASTERLRLDLGAERSSSIRRLASALGLPSPAFVVKTALFAYLHRTTGESSLRIAEPLVSDAGENLGLLDVEVADGETFASLAAKVAAETAENELHKDVPLRASADERLCNVSFADRRDSPRASRELSPYQSGQSPATGALNLIVRESSDAEGLALECDFNGASFDAIQRDRTMRHIVRALDAFASDPGAPVGGFPILLPEEEREVFATFNDTSRDYALDASLHARFEAQCAVAPEQIAVTFGDEHVTYGELNRRADVLARFLRRLGVERDVRVGVHMERSVDMVVALFAALKAGGAYLPLEPLYPGERLRYILEDAAVPVVLTSSAVKGGLPASGARIVSLDEEWPAILAADAPLALGVAHPDDLAYVIYTSGSTGKPKGVEIAHRGICNRLIWMQEAYGLTPQDRVLQKTPFSFDVSVWEFFWPLITGARLVVARPGGHLDPAYLVDLIDRAEVTTLHFVPSMLDVFLNHAGVDACASIKRVICSGEALGHELQERFFLRSRAELHNLYGPTEASVDVTFWKCDSARHRGIVPIGHPISNTRIYVLDARRRAVPPGLVGEVYLAGIGLARGYVNKPGLTAERFIEHTFPNGLRERLYRTSDLGRHLPDGAIEYLGRADSQIKLRGFRIELGEIEAVLARHAMVREAVDLLREDRKDDKRLVAYLVGSGPIDVAEVRRHAQKELPEYMVPAAYVVLESMPLTSNGKVDRRALPAPKATSDSPYAPARNDAEARLSDIWRRVLKIERVGVHDNFFDLGGHSLLLPALRDAIESELKSDVPLVKLLEHTTVASLAAHLKETDMNAGKAALGRGRERATRMQDALRSQQRAKKSESR